MDANHKKRWWRIPLIMIVGLLLAVIIGFFAMEIPKKLQAYEDLKAFLEQPAFSAEVTLDAQLDGTPLSASGTLHKRPAEDKPVYALETEGLTLGYHNDVIYMENGKAYGLGSYAPQSFSLPDNAGFLLPSIHVERDGEQVWYQFQLSREEAKSLSPDLISLTLVMETEARKINSLHLTAALKEDHVSLFLRPVENTDYTIPQTMETAIRSGVQPETEDLIGDILPLLSGFGDYFTRETRETAVTLAADCGPLDLSDSFVLTSGSVDGIEISSVQRKERSLYFAGSKVYTEEGRLLMENEGSVSSVETINTVQILGLAYTLCLNGDYELNRQAETSRYTITLDEAGMEELSRVILPETSQMEIFFDAGVMEITVNECMLDQLSVTLSGNLDLFFLKVPVSISTVLSFPAAVNELIVPQAVLDAIK